MNNLLTYSHHLNNVMLNVQTISKSVADNDKKMKAIERQLSDMQTILNRLQDRLIDIDSSSRQTHTVAPPQSVSEEKIKLLIKEQVDCALKAMLDHANTESPVPVTENESTQQAITEAFQSMPLGNDDTDMMYAQFDPSPSDIGEIVIEEKRTTKRGGRRPKKN